jgi:hypothetical protein
MPPDGAAQSGVEDFSGDCSRDAPGNCDEHAPTSSVPVLDGRAVASFVCVRAHRARGDSGRREAHSSDAVVPRSSAALRSRSLREVGPTHAERPAIRGEPQVRTCQCDAQPRAPLGSLPLEHHPYLVQRDTAPEVGSSRVSWRVAVGEAGPGSSRAHARLRTAHHCRIGFEAARRASSTMPPRPSGAPPLGLGCRANAAMTNAPVPPRGRWSF